MRESSGAIIAAFGAELDLFVSLAAPTDSTRKDSGAADSTRSRP